MMVWFSICMLYVTHHPEEAGKKAFENINSASIMLTNPDRNGSSAKLKKHSFYASAVGPTPTPNITTLVVLTACTRREINRVELHSWEQKNRKKLDKGGKHRSFVTCPGANNKLFLRTQTHTYRRQNPDVCTVHTYAHTHSVINTQVFFFEAGCITQGSWERVSFCVSSSSFSIRADVMSTL